VEQLPDEDVSVRVHYSSLNYKDALCATGHPGVARSLPTIPGIDAAGVVLSSRNGDFQVGDEVFIFHADFGTSAFGGFSQIARVPSDWVYRLPKSMSLRDVMTYGTAGFTAAQCVDQIVSHRIKPGDGPIVVTGATGGVGIFAVKLLSKLNFEVVAVTGKPDRSQWLRKCGASDVIARSNVDDSSDRPLLSAKWAGAVDTVGGNTLATILRATRHGGCVTACGLVGGAKLSITVYPFILRGVTLQGVDSAAIGRDYRIRLWDKMATEWRLEGIHEVAHEVSLDELEPQIQDILAGRVTGRVIVNLK
jgi:putative YhdH/YhfP family quinone oxidoreductase